MSEKPKGRVVSPETRSKISKALKGKPKNNTSWLKGRKGANHPAFKHGQGASRTYDYELHSAWIQGVKRASNFQCFITGKKSNLECHHLIGFPHEPTRYLIENGVAIFKEIHVSFHNEYGRGSNTPKQFEEFCTKNYKITSFPWRQGNHKPSFNIFKEQEIIINLSKTKANQFSELVISRQHAILEGFYVNNNSSLKIHCLKHKTDHIVKAGCYKKAVFGLRCCSSEKQGAVVAIANTKRKRQALWK